MTNTTLNIEEMLCGSLVSDACDLQFGLPFPRQKGTHESLTATYAFLIARWYEGFYTVEDRLRWDSRPINYCALMAKAIGSDRLADVAPSLVDPTWCREVLHFCQRHNDTLTLENSIVIFARLLAHISGGLEFGRGSDLLKCFDDLGILRSKVNYQFLRPLIDQAIIVGSNFKT